MTITTNPSRDEYTSTAGQTVFNYTFKIYANTDLNVYVTPLGQSPDDSADLTTDYVVDTGTIGDEAGGFITFNTPLNSGDAVTIVSAIPYDRTVDYQNNGDFLPETVNDDNDRQVSQIKQILEQTGRTLQFQESLQGASTLSLPDPIAANFMRWKSDLTGLENVELVDGALVVGNGQLLIFPTVSALKASTSPLLVSGVNVETQGYYTAGDGGGAKYLIQTAVEFGGTPDEFGNHTLANGNVAVLEQEYINNPKCWGAVFDGSTDVAPAINAMLSDGVTVDLPSDPCAIDTTVNILENSTIKFNNSRISTTNTTGTMFSAVSVDRWSLLGHAWLTGGAPGAETTQTLIRMEGCLNYNVENITCYRSLGHGFLIATDGVIEKRAEHGRFNNCLALECRTGWEFEDGTSAEYTVLTGCSAIQNVTGVKNGAGNTNWNGGNIVDNSIGIELYQGSNDNHGIFSGVNINHNANRNLVATDVANGYTFDGCHFYADGPVGSGTGIILIENSKQFNFNGGTLACPFQVETGAGTSNGTIVVKDAYINVESWFTITGTDLDNLVCKGLHGDSGLLEQYIYPPFQRVVDNNGFQNGWSDYGSGRGPLSYKKTEDGVVHINGVINGGSTAFATTVTTLPSGFEPTFIREFIVKEGATAGPHAPAYIQVDDLGNIVWLSGGNTQVSIDISYPVEG